MVTAPARVLAVATSRKIFRRFDSATSDWGIPPVSQFGEAGPVAGLKPEGPYLGGFGGRRAYKTIKTPAGIPPEHSGCARAARKGLRRNCAEVAAVQLIRAALGENLPLSAPAVAGGPRGVDPESGGATWAPGAPTGQHSVETAGPSWAFRQRVNGRHDFGSVTRTKRLSGCQLSPQLTARKQLAARGVG